MKNPLTDDGLYIITKPSNTGGLVAMAFKVEKSPQSWAGGKRVLWTWTNGGAPFDYVYNPSHMGHEDIVESFKNRVKENRGKLKTRDKPQPIAFVDNTGIWVFQRLKGSPSITEFIGEVMQACNNIKYLEQPHTNSRISILDSEEDRIAEAVANDPDVQAIRDLVARLGKKEE